jgi:hypothetical protein
MGHVRFERQNLADAEAPLPSPGGPFDLVLCRNVLIYLTREAQLAVSRRLAHSLAPGGMLIAGASDAFVDLPGLWQRSVAPSGVSFLRLEERQDAGAAAATQALQPKDASLGPRATQVRRRRAPGKGHGQTKRVSEAPGPRHQPATERGRRDPSDAVGRAAQPCRMTRSGWSCTCCW